VGTACAVAVGGFRVGPAIAALVGAVLIQIGTNFANDYFDAKSGADNEHRIGPIRATQSGLLSAAAMRNGTVVVFAAALAVGLYLTAIAGWPVVAIGVASIAAGIAYTGGPYPLGYHGLGDLFVLIFFGFVAVVGTAYVQLEQVSSLALIAALPIGALATAILVVNNIRDRATDAVSGKRTLAVILGRRFALLEYGLLLAIAYATPVWLWLAQGFEPVVLLPLATAPIAVGLLRYVTTTDGAALNRALGGTARLLLLFGALFTAALVLG
jgi:1,4-dihydroxy-2-naphthoate octaprenyltransferase